MLCQNLNKTKQDEERKLYLFFRSKTEQEDPSVLLQYLRPLIVNEFEVQVHWRKKQQTWEGKRVLIVDQECLALYSKPYEVGTFALAFAFFVIVRVVISIVDVIIIVVVVVAVALLLLLLVFVSVIVSVFVCVCV